MTTTAVSSGDGRPSCPGTDADTIREAIDAIPSTEGNAGDQGTAGPDISCNLKIDACRSALGLNGISGSLNFTSLKSLSSGSASSLSVQAALKRVPKLMLSEQQRGQKTCHGPAADARKEHRLRVTFPPFFSSFIFG